MSSHSEQAPPANTVLSAVEGMVAGFAILTIPGLPQIATKRSGSAIITAL
jgi:hypothetical protein